MYEFDYKITGLKCHHMGNTATGYVLRCQGGFVESGAICEDNNYWPYLRPSEVIPGVVSGNRVLVGIAIILENLQT